MITKHEWWSTPVWEIETGFDEYFNLCFKNELVDLIHAGKPNIRVDVWSIESYYCIQLKNKIYEILDSVLPEYFTNYHEWKPFLSDGWLNQQQPGETFPLHIHERSDLACVYYIQALENSGDLIMVDARGSAA